MSPFVNNLKRYESRKEKKIEFRTKKRAQNKKKHKSKVNRQNERRK